MFTDVQETKLKNGMRVITSRIPHVQSAAVGLWAGAGSRHEPVKFAGISHFLEHMLFKGTTKRSALEISRAIEGRGGYLNAFTQEESTCYYARVSYDRLASAFDVLSDMLLHARCSAADTAKEKQVILEEMRMYADQPQHVVQELLQQAVWPKHPLGRPVIGFPESVQAIQSGDLLSYKTKAYVPSRLVAAFAGLVDHEKCVAMVQDAFGSLPKAGAPRTLPFRETERPIPAIHAKREIEQNHLAIAVRLFGRSDEQRSILRVLNVILGENMSSRLFQIVREKHGLAYSIHSSAHLQKDTGFLVVHAGLDRQRGAKALDLILREMARLITAPVKASELKRAKDYIIGQLRLGLENTSSQMMWIGGNLLSHGRFIDPDETIRNTQAVTAEDVQKLAAQYFLRKNISIAAVTPMQGGGLETPVLENAIKVFPAR
jgi:predicted Zn-dependent peptidase